MASHNPATEDTFSFTPAMLCMFILRKQISIQFFDIFIFSSFSLYEKYSSFHSAFSRGNCWSEWRWRSHTHNPSKFCIFYEKVVPELLITSLMSGWQNHDSLKSHKWQYFEYFSTYKYEGWHFYRITHFFFFFLSFPCGAVSSDTFLDLISLIKS